MGVWCTSSSARRSSTASRRRLSRRVSSGDATRRETALFVAACIRQRPVRGVELPPPVASPLGRRAMAAVTKKEASLDRYLMGCRRWAPTRWVTRIGMALAHPSKHTSYPCRRRLPTHDSSHSEHHAGSSLTRVCVRQTHHPKKDDISYICATRVYEKKHTIGKQIWRHSFEKELTQFDKPYCVTTVCVFPVLSGIHWPSFILMK